VGCAVRRDLAPGSGVVVKVEVAST
jgi:hypothetical protein